MMKSLLYEYAEDEQGRLVHISIAERGFDYKCVECGDKLIIKEGTKKRKHFAHKGNTNCNGESYIHKIWKRRIKYKFENCETFPIRYFVGTPCGDTNTCPIRKTVSNIKCNVGYVKEIDLKKEYDTCKEEYEYKGFVGDLVLLNSKQADLEPLFIEVAYSHPCDEEKIKSGIKIVELQVVDDRDADINLFEHGILELTLNRGNPYDNQCTTKVRFYNFNRLPYPTIGTYLFTHDNGGNCEMRYYSVKTCKQTSHPFEGTKGFVVELSDDIVHSREQDYYMGGIMAIAALNGYVIRNCLLCSHRVYYNACRRPCPAMKKAMYDTAKECSNYKVLKSDCRRMVERLRNVPHTANHIS